MVHPCLFFTNEEQKKLAYDIMYTSATHALVVCDITDTYCQTANSSTHGHSDLSDFQLSSFNKLDLK